MDNCVGIIAEYNPFHNGHLHHLHASKRLANAKHAIVVLSGGMVQRGEPATFSKSERTVWALSHGASMVLELPSLFSLGCAERFAFGGVYSLLSTGLISHLAFGAEDADSSMFFSIANAQLTPSRAFLDALKTELKRGASFPAARSNAVYATLGQDAQSFFLKPNNILGIEYTKALLKLNACTKLLPIKRLGSLHDDDKMNNGFTSASAIRRSIPKNDFEFIRHGVPEDIFKSISKYSAEKIGIDEKALFLLIMNAFMRLDCRQIAALPDVSEGLDNLIYSACRSALTLDEFYNSIKSKRYTLSRLRRISMYGLLGMSKADFALHDRPEYLRVLGVKKDALPLLSRLNASATLPVVCTYKDTLKLNQSAQAQLAFERLAVETRALCCNEILPRKEEYAQRLIVI